MLEIAHSGDRARRRPGSRRWRQPGRTMASIVAEVAVKHRFTVAELRDGKQAYGRRSAARQEALWLIHEEGFSHPEAARFFGLKDHTSSIWACAAHGARMAKREAA